jgi:hypothetical protein
MSLAAIISFRQEDLPSLPTGATGPWKYIYAVDDHGNKPSSDAPIQVGNTTSKSVVFQRRLLSELMLLMDTVLQDAHGSSL